MGLSNKEFKLRRDGYPQGADGSYYPPGTVWVVAGSRVYHSCFVCGGGNELNEYVIVTESEAARRGLRRCKKCEWDVRYPVPAPSKKPLKSPKPVARF